MQLAYSTSEGDETLRSERLFPCADENRPILPNRAIRFGQNVFLPVIGLRKPIHHIPGSSPWNRITIGRHA
jgi:hypothetical protein